MALYLGNDKIKINLNGIAYCLNLYLATPIIEGIRLLSSDNYILRDSNGMYLTINESESEIPNVSGIIALSSDNYILTDSNRIYLTMKESE